MGSFKEILSQKDVEKVSPVKIVTGVENISKVCTDATIEEAEKIWPVLEASLDIDQGEGLAAIQIGILKKVAIVKYQEKTYRLLNSKIVDKASSIIIYNEGCLSIPGKTVNTERYSDITVHDDVLGNISLDMSADGLLPIIFQHEIDHFNGETIFDRRRKPIVRTCLLYTSPSPRDS